MKKKLIKNIAFGVTIVLITIFILFLLLYVQPSEQGEKEVHGPRSMFECKDAEDTAGLDGYFSPNETLIVFDQVVGDPFDWSDFTVTAYLNEEQILLNITKIENNHDYEPMTSLKGSTIYFNIKNDEDTGKMKSGDTLEIIVWNDGAIFWKYNDVKIE